MADETAKADKAAADPRPSQSSPDKAPEERRFDVDELMARARLSLGVSPVVVAGALEGERTKTFTLDAAEKKINTWLKQPIEREFHDAEAAA